ncbi:MAG: amidohydrolase family protein [Bryobacterales bacterium]|nr:amidohydrolase family protein [Bryobacterales bacterium]
MHTLNRRGFVGAAGMAAAAAQEAPIPIIDTHFHLYDQTRPQGAPFPFTPNNPPFLPKHFRESAIPVGVVGGIKVEASPWVEDNLWVLMIIQDEPMITGMIGNLDPMKQDFQEFLERYHRNKLFLGIRYGNVWPGQDLVAAIEKPDAIANLRAFAKTGLTLEVANPRLDLIEATLRLTDKVPDLRIVLGHLQALALPTDGGVLKKYEATLRELRARKAFVKVSGLYRPRNAPAGVWDPATYKPTMDFIYDIFGEDYTVFAGRNKTVIDIFRAYFAAKGRPALEKFFWKNSIAAFRWVKREAGQPQLG